MFDAETMIDVIHRVQHVLAERCGEAPGEPPPGWPEVVQAAWPSMWFRAPYKIPAGWVDIIIAMSAHVAEIDPTAQFHDAFENVIDGSLGIRVGTSDTEVIDVVDAYEHVATLTCRVCSAEGSIRMRSPHRSPAALCDRHADSRHV